MEGPVAIVYDFLQVVGGAELFSLELARRLPAARLVVAGVAADFPRGLLPSNLHVLDPRPLPQGPGQRALFAMRAFLRSRHLLGAFSAVVLSGHYAPLLYRRAPGTCWLYYAHTTPVPFLHEDRERVVAGASVARRILHRMAARALERRLQKMLTSGVTALANSAYTASTYAQRLGVQARVLHPPCDTEGLAPRPSEGYFLSFARQEPGKRVDAIVEAFRRLPGERLVVASRGSEHERLRRLAAEVDNIDFVPTTSSNEIRDLLARSRASVYIPSREPFGISAVESLAAGKPVIAARSGGLPEIVEDGATGWLIPEDAGADALGRAIGGAPEHRCAAMAGACRQAAGRFGWPTFLEGLSEVLPSVAHQQAGRGEWI